MTNSGNTLQVTGTISVEVRNQGSKSEHKGFVFRPEDDSNEWYELLSDADIPFPDVENDDLTQFVGKKVTIVARKISGRKLLVAFVTIV